MQCHEAKNIIPRLLDGLLDYEEEFAVRQHVNGCPDCRSLLNAYEQDEMTLSGYVRRAPYAPVARDVIAEIERGRSPWWDAFRAGSYRLASVAGLALVILVVGAGAWMLREVATTEPTTDDPPAEETMNGTTDAEDSAEQVDESNPPMIGMENVDLIVEQLDEAGLVFGADAVSEGEGYSVEYGRVAFDRHLTLLEYQITRLDNGARLMVGAFGIEGGGGADFSDDDLPREGWLALPGIDPDTQSIELQDGETLGDSALNVHQLDVDLSPIRDQEDERQTYHVADTANGIEGCCLSVERGIAVSTLSYEWEIVDENDLVFVDESLQPIDTPPEIDLTSDPIWPSVTVDDETISVLEMEIYQALMLEGEGVGVLDLPETGTLQVHYDHLMLPGEGDAFHLAIYEGPWTLSAQLEDPGAEPEPTPEPTEPPMVANEPTPEPEPQTTPVPADDDEADDELRLLVYMSRGAEIGASSRYIEHTQDVATAAMEALLAGPIYEDEDVGMHSEIPQGTEMLDISLDDGTLTVDLSAEFAEGGGSASILMRLAQVVHTGTQFNSVDDVQILIEGEQVETLGGEGVMVGEPLDRDDFEDQAPAILIETPAPHDVVGEVIRLIGTSNTFEANLQIEIVDTMGNQIYRDYATASSGTGTRGEFDLRIPVEFEGEGIGAVRMFEHSARDGSRTNVITIPVRFER